MGVHIFYDRNDVLTPEDSDDSQTLKDIMESRGCRRRTGGRGRLVRGDIIQEDLLHLSHSTAHGKAFLCLRYYRFHFDTVDGFLYKEFNPRFICGSDHILRGYLGEHNKGGVGQKGMHLAYKCNAVCLRHKKIYDHDIRREGRKIFKSIGGASGASADGSEIPFRNDYFQNVAYAFVVVN